MIALLCWQLDLGRVNLPNSLTLGTHAHYTSPSFLSSIMAGKPDDTSTILKNFAIIFPAFYIVYYVIVLLLSAIVGSAVSGGQPFDHVNFDPGQGDQALGK